MYALNYCYCGRANSSLYTSSYLFVMYKYIDCRIRPYTVYFLLLIFKMPFLHRLVTVDIFHDDNLKLAK